MLETLALVEASRRRVPLLHLERHAAASERRRPGLDRPQERASDASTAEVRIHRQVVDVDERPRTGVELTRQLRDCVQPSARRMFRPVSAGLVGWARRWPFTCIVILALFPNVIAGVFNFAYNRAQIVERLGDSQDVFWRVQGVINAIAFPLEIRTKRGKRQCVADGTDNNRRQNRMWGQREAWQQRCNDGK